VNLAKAIAIYLAPVFLLLFLVVLTLEGCVRTINNFKDFWELIARLP